MVLQTSTGGLEDIRQDYIYGLLDVTRATHGCKMLKHLKNLLWVFPKSKFNIMQDI